jgi:hypothetical protein
LFSDKIVPVLHLEPPKKVIQYVASSVPIVDPSKAPKGPRTKIVKSKNNFKTVKRALPEVASIYAEEHTSSATSSSYDDAPASKKARLSRGGAGGAAEEDDDEGRRQVEADAEDEYDNRAAARSATPSNFYAVVGPLFEEFWKLDFDNVEVTWAFFALITHYNCKDYRLEAFAEKSYSLAVIKVLFHLAVFFHLCLFTLKRCYINCCANLPYYSHTGKIKKPVVLFERRFRVRLSSVVRQYI